MTTPPQGDYPPQQPGQGSYDPQAFRPQAQPQQGATYPPQQGATYPPQQGATYPPQQGATYPPQAGPGSQWSSGPATPTPSGRPASGRRTGLLIGAGVVSAAVISVGAYAVMQPLGGGGDQPSDALPANTAAYLRLDINPTVGQKIAAVRFIEGLSPEVTETLQSSDIRKEVFEMLAAEDEAFSGLDYDADINPWLGDRLGMGVVPDGDDEPMVAIALQVKDQDAAEAGLTKLQGMGGGEADVSWFFHNDYVVLTSAADGQALEAAVNEGTLAGSETFSDDMAALGDEGVMSGWMDAAALGEYADTMSSAAPLQDLEEATSLDSSALSYLGMQNPFEGQEGRVAGAVLFAEDSIEIHGVTRGFSDQGIENTDSAQLVLDLPEDTAVAMGLEHGDQLVATTWEAAKKQFPNELAEAQAQAGEAGFELPGDLQTLVGQSMAVGVSSDIVTSAMSGMEDPSQLPVAVRVQTDTAKANGIIDELFEVAGVSQEERDMLVRSEDDGVLTLGFSQSYVDEVSQGGSLGGLSTFQNAVKDAEDADAVLYIDLNAFEQFYLGLIEDPEVRGSVEKIAAVGASASMDEDGNGDWSLRIVADGE